MKEKNELKIFKKEKKLKLNLKVMDILEQIPEEVKDYYW